MGMHKCSAGPKGGGQKGHMPPPPPEATTRHTLVPVRVAHSNPIPTRLQSVKMVGHQ